MSVPFRAPPSRSTPEARPASPAARRARRPSWRDPRLAIGIALVCLSVLVGAQVLQHADDTVPVLAARDALAAGMPVSADDLMTVRVRFASAADADLYLSGPAQLTDGAVLLRPVGPGELLPRAALGPAGGPQAVELPLAVDPARVPSSTHVGSLVDVWVTASEDAARSSSAPVGTEKLLTGVSVLSTTSSSAVGPSGVRQVVVAVPAADQHRLSRIVARVGAGGLFLVGRPG